MPNLLTIEEIDHVAFCELGMNPEAKIVLWKAVEKRDFSSRQRDRMAGNGEAMSGGGFPIANVSDLRNAIQAIGRAKDPAAAKAHIKQRARALGRTDLIPDSWGKALKKGTTMADFDLDTYELEDDVRSAIADALEAANKGRTDAEAKVTTLEDRVAELEKGKPEPKPEDLVKDLPEDHPIRKRMEQLEADNRKNAETVADLLRKSREAEFTNVAKGFKNLGKAEELGVLLLDVADAVDDKVFKSLTQLLKTADARIDLTAELGTIQPTLEEDELNKAVADIRKANPELSREQAVTRALEANPRLYKAVG